MNEQLKLEWANLEIDIKRLKTDINEQVDDIMVSDCSTYPSHSLDGSEFETKSALKKYKKYELIDIILELQDALNKEKDEFGAEYKEMLEDKLNFFLKIPERITDKLNDFKRLL